MRIAGLLSYEGTAYHGFQIQPNDPTIQGVIEQVLAEILGQTVRITAAGRTDAGVHALGQVFHFDVPAQGIPPEKWGEVLNQRLPSDVRVLKAGRVADEFHSRFDAKARRYRYHLSHPGGVLDRNHEWQLRCAPDQALLRTLAALIPGERDFSSFCQARSDTENRICQVRDSAWLVQESSLVFQIEADRFLHHMVRMLVGTMVEIARGKWQESYFEQLLQVPDPQANTFTAPAHGLILEKVSYPETTHLPWT